MCVALQVRSIVTSFFKIFFHYSLLNHLHKMAVRFCDFAYCCFNTGWKVSEWKSIVAEVHGPASIIMTPDSKTMELLKHILYKQDKGLGQNNCQVDSWPPNFGASIALLLSSSRNTTSVSFSVTVMFILKVQQSPPQTVKILQLSLIPAPPSVSERIFV